MHESSPTYAMLCYAVPCQCSLLQAIFLFPPPLHSHSSRWLIFCWIDCWETRDMEGTCRGERGIASFSLATLLLHPYSSHLSRHPLVVDSIPITHTYPHPHCPLFSDPAVWVVGFTVEHSTSLYTFDFAGGHLHNHPHSCRAAIPLHLPTSHRVAIRVDSLIISKIGLRYPHSTLVV